MLFSYIENMLWRPFHILQTFEIKEIKIKNTLTSPDYKMMCSMKALERIFFLSVIECPHAAGSVTPGSDSLMLRLGTEIHYLKKKKKFWTKF